MPGRRVLKSGQISKSQSLINSALERQRDAFNLITELEMFAEDTALSGEAYASAKGYVRNILIPINKAICVALEDEIAANRKVIDFCNMYLTDVDLIDEDIISNQISDLGNDIDDLQDDWWEYLPYIREVNLVRIAYKRKQIRKLEEQLDKLEAFDNTTKGLHETAVSQMNTVTQNISSIYSQPIFVNGRYDYVGIDMRWTDGFVLAWSMTKGHTEYQFKKNLRVEFGFDKETVNTMWEVYGKLKEKYPDASDEEIAWRFTRLMGGLFYDEDFKAKFQWDETAGDAIGYYNLGVHRFPIPEEKYFVEILGIKKEDYINLRFNVCLQHMVVGGSRLPNSMDELNSTARNNFSKWKNEFINKTGVDCSNEEFLAMWNKQYDNSFKKGDYAHQQITTSAILGKKAWNLSNLGPFATKSKEEIILAVILSTSVYGKYFNDNVKELTWSNKKVIEKAGWLGDATIGKKAFGPEDYIADLDAQNIVTYMKEKNTSYPQAANQYYGDLTAGQSRATIFLKDTSLEHIKKSIYKDLVGDGAYNIENIKKESEDVYQFIRNLEAENTTMEKMP